jgi:enoyl-[acyl-carrier-protein] reductase (NADH)
LTGVKAQFKDAGAKEPVILEADAAQDDDTKAVFARIKESHNKVEAIISNVAFAQVTRGLDSYKKRGFLKSLDYSAWPFVGYLKLHHEVFGNFPRYSLGMSSDGADTYYPGYEFVAAAKTVMETFCRYLAVHMLDEDVRINVLRARPVLTESLTATFGPEFVPFHRKYCGDDYFINVDEVANTALALCSGLMDAVSGEVISLDRGRAFNDNSNYLFEHRVRLGLASDTES